MTLDHGYVDIQVIDQLVGRVVNRVRVASTLGRSRRPLHQRSVTVDGELRLPIQDGEHLFDRVVKVFRHAAAGLHLATK